MDTTFHVIGDPDVLLSTLCPIEDGLIRFGHAGRSRIRSDHAQLLSGQVEIVDYIMEGHVPYLLSAERDSVGIRLTVRKTGTPRDEYIDLSVASYLSSRDVSFSKSPARAGATTHCLGCGKPVVLTDVISTLGRCPACFPRCGSRREPAGAAIVGSYFPGFSDDLTYWTTTIFNDGLVQQVITGCPPDCKSRRMETREAVVNASSLQALLDLIAAIDRLGIAELNNYCSIDDAPSVCLTAPALGFHASLDLWEFAEIVVHEDVPPHAKSGLATFQKAWQAIEAVSPYTTEEHWKCHGVDD